MATRNDIIKDIDLKQKVWEYKIIFRQIWVSKKFCDVAQ
jgi:hypothetical protein